MLPSVDIELFHFLEKVEEVINAFKSCSKDLGDINNNLWLYSDFYRYVMYYFRG